MAIYVGSEVSSLVLVVDVNEVLLLSSPPAGVSFLASARFEAALILPHMDPAPAARCGFCIVPSRTWRRRSVAISL